MSLLHEQHNSLDVLPTNTFQTPPRTPKSSRAKLATGLGTDSRDSGSGSVNPYNTYRNNIIPSDSEADSEFHTLT